MRNPRPYPTETTDDAEDVGAPSLPVIATQSPQRQDAVRVLVNPLGWIVRTGAPWGDCVQLIFCRGRRSRNTRRAGCMADGLTPSATRDGLSCAQRRATQASRAVSLALHAHRSRAATAVRVPAMTARHARKGRDTTVAVAVLGHPMQQLARLRRPKRLREITREHGPSWRRSTEAFA